MNIINRHTERNLSQKNRLPVSLLAILLTCCFAIGSFLPASALPADFYAASSRLASGKWAKIQVKATGMQFISNAQLKNLGFADPAKVNVYGFGGRLLSEDLNDAMPDDLPPIASLQTPSGIIFFGHAAESWRRAPESGMKYRHSLNPYSDSSYYFISDTDPQRFSPELTSNLPTASTLEVIESFTERAMHEQDLIAPAETGRLLLGEDFRTQSSRSFQFSLPGNTGDAMVRVAMGAKVTNGQSSFIVSANGSDLPSTASDRIAGINSSEVFINMASSVKKVQGAGEKLNLTIKYNYSGAIFTAALDYIEVEYSRPIKIDNDELYFYVSPAEESIVMVKGFKEDSRVWDVTDPADVKEIKVAYDNGSATFTVPAGYREYVAFHPQSVKRTVTPAGQVANQDLHAMEAPGMLVVAPDQYLDAARRLARLHKETDGLDVAVVTPTQVYNEFSSGVPDVTAFRKLLKMWYDRAGGDPDRYTRYCLLMSRPTYDNKMATQTVRNAGYPRIPIWQSPNGYSEQSSYSTDDYIGMLADNTRSFIIDNQPLHVAVGRFPVKSVAEANAAVAKLEKYVKNPVYGSWRNSVMVIADDQDNGDHLNQAEKVISGMRSTSNGRDYLYEKLYLDSYPLVMSGTGATYPQATRRMLDKINEGVAFIDYIGHANPREWGHEKLLTWSDIKALSNTNLPFIYAATCEFMNWDADAVSGAEELWLKPDAGIIGMICPSRKVYIALNGDLNIATSPYIFPDNSLKPNRIGDFMIAGKNYKNESNKLRYGLMGDPAMALPSPSFKLVVDAVDGKPVGEEADLPVIKARSKTLVTGHIADAAGNTVTDFNGEIDVRLYDAEKVVETLGNGTDGVVIPYNDRKTRLAVTKTKASAGQWSAELLLPSEIENNYSPALLSLYAYDDKGREANGSFEDFYVYGIDESAPDDNEGPAIAEFYLNTPSFKSGDEVGPAPIVYARFSDPSGINLSDAGIGHNMTLSLDGKKVFDDLSSCFTPDPASPESGSIAYPLSGVEPGKHDLTLTVWDNANNSSSSTLSFAVSASWQPSISGLSTDVSPASSSVSFLIDTDAPAGAAQCRLEVFNLLGRKVWSETVDASASSSVSVFWNLRDFSGTRVPRGIYLYRATILTGEGAEISKTNKLAVTAG